MEDFKALNLELLDGYIDSLGKDIVEQMFNLYVSQSIEYMGKITQAMESGSQIDWQESCHKMKGAAASAGLLLVHGKLVDIEKSSESLLVKADHIKALNTLNEEAIDAFKVWLSA